MQLRVTRESVKIALELVAQKEGNVIRLQVNERQRCAIFVRGFRHPDLPEESRTSLRPENCH